MRTAWRVRSDTELWVCWPRYRRRWGGPAASKSVLLSLLLTQHGFQTPACQRWRGRSLVGQACRDERRDWPRKSNGPPELQQCAACTILQLYSVGRYREQLLSG